MGGAEPESETSRDVDERLIVFVTVNERAGGLMSLGMGVYRCQVLESNQESRNPSPKRFLSRNSHAF